MLRWLRGARRVLWIAIKCAVFLGLPVRFMRRHGIDAIETYGDGTLFLFAAVSGAAGVALVAAFLVLRGIPIPPRARSALLAVELSAMMLYAVCWRLLSAPLDADCGEEHDL